MAALNMAYTPGVYAFAASIPVHLQTTRAGRISHTGKPSTDSGIPTFGALLIVRNGGVVIPTAAQNGPHVVGADGETPLFRIHARRGSRHLHRRVSLPTYHFPPYAYLRLILRGARYIRYTAMSSTNKHRFVSHNSAIDIINTQVAHQRTYLGLSCRFATALRCRLFRGGLLTLHNHRTCDRPPQAIGYVVAISFGIDRRGKFSSIWHRQ